MRVLDVTCIVATYGDFEWVLRGAAAFRSIPEGVHAIQLHRDTLAEARNVGAEHATTDWLCFLDADDSLEPGYFDVAGPQVDVIVPRVRYVGPPPFDGTDEENPPGWNIVVARHPDHEGLCGSACLEYGNHIVIGAPIRRSLFERVGGFRELPLWEDWDLWRRCWRAGARFGRVEGSIYRAYVNPQGRNHGLTAAERRAVQDAIVA